MRPAARRTAAGSRPSPAAARCRRTVGGGRPSAGDLTVVGFYMNEGRPVPGISDFTAPCRGPCKDDPARPTTVLVRASFLPRTDAEIATLCARRTYRIFDHSLPFLLDPVIR